MNYWVKKKYARVNLKLCLLWHTLPVIGEFSPSKLCPVLKTSKFEDGGVPVERNGKKNNTCKGVKSRHI